MKTIILLLSIVLIAATSCGTNAVRPSTREALEDKAPKLCRAKVLGIGYITEVSLSYDQNKIYRHNDTVFIDLKKHIISDSAKDAVLCVIYKPASNN